jgi:hypothetical protein
VATDPKERWSVPDVRSKLDEIDRLNERLDYRARLLIYTVAARLLAEIEIGPADHDEPTEVFNALDDYSVAWLRVADRFVWFDDEQLDAVIKALQLSREANYRAMGKPKGRANNT